MTPAFTMPWRRASAGPAQYMLLRAAVAVLVLTQGSSGESGPDKLLPADGAAYDEFARTVAIDGNWVLAGAHFDSDAGWRCGSAYVFKRQEGAWTQEAKLTASDAAAEDRFGETVALDKDTAVIAAPFDDDRGSNSGAVYVFRRQAEGGWSQEGKLLAPGGAADDEFGASVSIEAGRILIGSPRDDDGGEESGSAYLFQREIDGWMPEAKFTASDAAPYDRFGRSVGLSGDFALIGAYLDDRAATNAGAVHVFRAAGGLWSPEGQLTAPDAGETDYFGWSLAVSGSDALVGAPFHDQAGRADAGAAYVFRFDGVSWVLSGKLTAPEPAAGDFFGFSVALHGDYAVIGAYADATAGRLSGAAWLFRRSDAGWNVIAKLAAPDRVAGDQFGQAVSLGVPYAVIGSPLDDASGARSGSAYVYGVTDCTLLSFDADRDCDLDEADVQAFHGCYTGPEVALPFVAPGCARFDLDADQDVDQSDFGRFQRCLSGTGLTYPPDC